MKDLIELARQTVQFLDERLRNCSKLPVTAAEAYDSFYQEMVSDALVALLAAEEGIAASAQDAARYRWLRAQPNNIVAPRVDVVHWQIEDETCNGGTGLRMEELDSVIDAAIKEPKP